MLIYAISNIIHNGEYYKRGEVIKEITDAQARVLIEDGVASENKPTDAAPAEVVEAPKAPEKAPEAPAATDEKSEGGENKPTDATAGNDSQGSDGANDASVNL